MPPSFSTAHTTHPFMHISLLRRFGFFLSEAAPMAEQREHAGLLYSRMDLFTSSQEQMEL